MIYIVERPGCYVAAVLSSTLQLQEYLNKLTPATLGLLNVQAYEFLTYPFCFIEEDMGHDKRRFKIVDEEANYVGNDFFLKLRYSKLGASPLAIYTIYKDFWGDPLHPWKDYMGALPHRHLEEQNEN